MSKVVKIGEQLDATRREFHTVLERKLGVPFPLSKADELLSKAINESNILNPEVNIKKQNKRGTIFDITF